MAAKRKKPLPDLHDLLGQHMMASARRAELLEECGRHRDAGRLAAARKVLTAAEKIHKQITAIEDRLARRRP